MTKVVASFEANGKAWKLQYPFSTLKKIESHYKKPMSEIGERLSKSMLLEDLGTLVFYGLQKEHPGITEDAVDELIDEAGVEKVMAAFGDAYSGDRPTKAAKAS